MVYRKRPAGSRAGKKPTGLSNEPPEGSYAEYGRRARLGQPGGAHVFETFLSCPSAGLPGRCSSRAHVGPNDRRHAEPRADGFLVYVMPYIEGESLRDRMRREVQLPVDDAVRLIREVADALALAHRNNIVHRDIKPENILLDAGHAVVADFGIARAIDEAGGDKLTETGLAIGTPSYMSPEQVTGESTLDGRSDTYALGCVLYEMLAGEVPYTGPTAQAIIAKRLSDPVPSVRRIRAAVPEAVDAAIYKALQPVPADRFATTDAFVVIDGADSTEALFGELSGSIPFSSALVRSCRL